LHNNDYSANNVFASLRLALVYWLNRAVYTEEAFLQEGNVLRKWWRGVVLCSKRTQHLRGEIILSAESATRLYMAVSHLLVCNYGLGPSQDSSLEAICLVYSFLLSAPTLVEPLARSKWQTTIWLELAWS